MLWVFLRKVRHELTTASPPLFAEEAWPWANIHAHLLLLYMWDAYHSMACQAVTCPHPGSEPAKPGPPRSRPCELNCCATGLPWEETVYSFRGSLWNWLLSLQDVFFPLSVWEDSSVGFRDLGPPHGLADWAHSGSPAICDAMRWWK